ncbi:MAG: hypothetical protein QG604_992 [Candidatus Dependentiae bacterium]|nr:hypothetical protein [Candidatus Dependentiae bacterium]
MKYSPITLIMFFLSFLTFTDAVAADTGAVAADEEATFSLGNVSDVEFLQFFDAVDRAKFERLRAKWSPFFDHIKAEAFPRFLLALCLTARYAVAEELGLIRKISAEEPEDEAKDKTDAKTLGNVLPNADFIPFMLGTCLPNVINELRLDGSKMLVPAMTKYTVAYWRSHSTMRNSGAATSAHRA